MRDRLDNAQLDQPVTQHMQSPAGLTGRWFTTHQRDQVRFAVPIENALLFPHARLALQCGLQPFLYAPLS